MVVETIRHAPRGRRHVRHPHLDDTVRAQHRSRLTLAQQRHRARPQRLVDVARAVGGRAASDDEHAARPHRAAVGAETRHRHVVGVGHVDPSVEQSREPPAGRQGRGGHHCTTPAGRVSAGATLGAYAQRVASDGGGPKSTWRRMSAGSSGVMASTRMLRAMISAYTGAATSPP